MLRRYAIVVAAVLLAAGTTSLAGEAVLQVQGDWKREGADRSLEQTISLASEITSYGLTYDITIPADAPAGKCASRQWVFKTGYVPLGMTAPGRANWYYQGFLSLRLDDLSLHDFPITFRAVRSGGPDALVEGAWTTPKGPVFLRLAVRGGDDKLLMQIALPPATKAEKVELVLNAYPQGFEKPWDRHITTATRDVPGTPGASFDPGQERWALYSDERMRRQRAGSGPCGLVYVPDEVQPVRAGGEYGVTTRLVTRPGGRTITLGLWDFTSIGDAEVMRTHLRRDGCLIAEDLACLARADWSQPLPAPRLSPQYTGFLAELARRRLAPTAFDEMTGQVVTPHRTWAKPLAGGPVRALVVAPRWNQRGTVELAQRLDLDYDTLSFCTADKLQDSNLYLYDSYDLYGYERKTEAAVLTSLSNKLQADRDVLILSSFRPQLVPEHLRRRIADKVRGGKGLVLLGSAASLLEELGPVQPAAWDGSVVPVERLPVLGKMAGEKKPIWSAYTLGKGRVLVFHYSTGGSYARQGLTPHFTMDDPDVLGYYDYYHSLLSAGVLWAAGRPMRVRLQFPAADKVAMEAQEAVPEATLEVLVHDPARGFQQQAKTTVNIPQGASPHTLPAIGLASGARYTSVWVRGKDGKVLGWGTGYADLPAGPRIAAIELRSAVAKPGDAVGGTIRLSDTPAQGSIEIELWDARGRLLAAQTVRPTAPAVPFQFTLPPTVAIVHEVRARLSDGGRLVDQQVEEFSVPDQAVDDFHFLAWIDGGNNPVTQAILGVLADGGVDWIDNTGLTGATEAVARASVRNAARYGLRSIPYATRIHSDQMTGRVRQPCLTDPAWQERWTAGLRERAKGAAPYGCPGYTLGDENYLVSRAPVDVCTSPTCLAGFRTWLRERYGSIERLNATWKTTWKNWNEVVPATLDEVRGESAHWPRWVDHRLFMSRVFAEAHARGREAIRSVDPQARVGFDGLFALDSWHGYDFYQLCQACDLVQVYALHAPSQIEYLRAWRQPGAIVGGWYNAIGNRDETSARRLGWHLLFHQFNSSWYWMAYGTGPALLFPDLRPTPQFQWLQAAHAEIMGGIGKLLLRAERQHDGIALHYSQASVYAGTLLGRPADSAPLSGFAHLVEDLGLQYDVVSYEQIEKGKLKDYKVLVMPASTAISPAEAAAIRQFVEGGGLLLADTVPGMLDDHGQLLEKGLLDDLLGITRSGLPKRPGRKPLRVEAEGLAVELPLETYDAGLKPGTAKPWATAGDMPAVLVNRPGKGATVLLNAAVEQYTGLRRSGEGRATQAVLHKLLGLIDVRPQVRVTAGQSDVPACEIVRFLSGPIQYVCLLTDDLCADCKPEDVTVQLPRTAEVYDVRARTPLGATAVIKTRLLPGDPKIYALLPYRVDGLTVAPVAAKVVPGTAAAFDVAFQVPAKEFSGRHCLRIEVVGPDGKTLRHYAQNVLTDKLSTRVSIPLALNDPAGAWQLRATDVVTGRSAAVPFTVESGR